MVGRYITSSSYLIGCTEGLFDLGSQSFSNQCIGRKSLQYIFLCSFLVDFKVWKLAVHLVTVRQE